ncbi:serine dehydratase subunit alpha family protein [Clostridium niameyense]|uniref:L-cysteine desulfidase family protein n=1 Tax=Clostridium niameyense TaxID=1622073 RepID=UPI000AF76A37|nr:L-serine ammonia-lyase, iron-sulfur-dependent, subunit alpha [Clostridium niameyense]
MIDNNTIINILKKEMAPGLGVTEPAAIALATAKAYETIGGEFKKVEVKTDGGLFKNAFSCGIPGTCEIGNEFAAMLGIVAGDSSLGLEVLKNIEEIHVIKAKEFIDNHKVSFKVKDNTKGLYVEAIVTTNKGYGRILITNSHDNISLIEKNSEIIYEKTKENINNNESIVDSKRITKLTVNEIVNFVNTVDYNSISFLEKAVDMNKKLAIRGLEGSGLGLGKMLNETYKNNNDDYALYGEVLTCAAVDARVSGEALPAMTITGSGNHGIISTLPIVAVVEKNNLGKEKLVRAIALSYLINIYIKEFSGKLSAFCGCAVAAGTGVSAAITYLLGGNCNQIGYAIVNMASNITGMICSGGNLACSLKANTGVKASFLSSKMALENIVVPNRCGIVSNSVEETMKCIGKIAYPGMANTDKEILNIMVENSK